MAGFPRLPFRVLGPWPPSPQAVPHPDLALAADFPSRPQAAAFADCLRCFPFNREISTVPSPPVFQARWKISRPDVPYLAYSLKHGPKPFRSWGEVVEAGVRNHFHAADRILPGKGGWKFHWKDRSVVMGILNVTPDSFSDGGRFMDPEAALEKALQMQEEGADWVDVGGESTRPGAGGVSAAEEKRRILPVIRLFSRKLRIPVSVDTSKAKVAAAAVGAGARLVNDVGGLGLDPAMAGTVARLKVPLVLMHMKGRPRTMQRDPRYGDLVGDILRFFRSRLERAERAGLHPDRILLDPGFGFGKKPGHNVEMVRRLAEFRVLGLPLLLGPSRKSTLGHLLGGLPPSERLEATDAMVAACLLNGADWVRVHDVKNAVRVARITDAIRYGRGL